MLWPNPMLSKKQVWGFDRAIPKTQKKRKLMNVEKKFGEKSYIERFKERRNVWDISENVYALYVSGVFN